MIQIDIILGSKYESPWSEEMICTTGALVLIVAKSRIRAWSVQLQLDDGRENS